MNFRFAKIGSVALAALCAAAITTGCASGASMASAEAEQANRAYMSQVNETMVSLDDNLQQFVDAVSRGDVVNMRTQADNAYKALDKLNGIEAPESMSHIKSSYVEGSGKLRQALDGYITLYTDMSKSGSSIDKATYDKRLAEIQKLYDEGVAALQKGDEDAAANPGASGSASAAGAAPQSAASSASTGEASSSASASA